jgi:hypothetical protein
VFTDAGLCPVRLLALPFGNQHFDAGINDGGTLYQTQRESGRIKEVQSEQTALFLI